MRFVGLAMLTVGCSGSIEGEWELVELERFLVDGSLIETSGASGGLDAGEAGLKSGNGAVAVELVHATNEWDSITWAVDGSWRASERDFPLNLDGDVTFSDEDREFSVDVTGEWECQRAAARLDCAGELENAAEVYDFRLQLQR